MTGRERLTAILQKKPKDRLSWAPLADEHTLSRLSGDLKGINFLDFCRYLKGDIYLLNGWGTPHVLKSPELRWSDMVKETVSCQGQNPATVTTEWATPRGKLVGVSRGHPIKYPVDSLSALRIYREMWEGASFVGHDDGAALAALENLVGADGVVTRFWGPSTIPRLLEYDMGLENFYLLKCDYQEEVDGLIRLMHAKELQAFEFLAQGPWASALLCENTSTYYISPEVYARYNMPHQRDFVQAVHRAGKSALLHMCGHVRLLLKLIAETGCDGIHALTPPPTGDTPWEAALDVLGEDLVIFGGLDPAVWIMEELDAIGPYLDRLFTSRVRAANFSLLVGADGITVPLERFQAVSRWMAENG